MSTTFSTAARVWRVGADIDTDQLAPGHAMKSGIEVIARHCLEGVRPDFASGVQPGDVLVAGPNFGIGSSREQAASALVQLGVAAVIAPSFSGLYFRNAFNVGLLLLTCADAQQLQEGERIALDARAGSIVRADGQLLATEPIPGFLLDMVEAGGLLAQLQQRFSQRTPS
jgi:3-isopropylmalate/(R)-2-methylmalate dehydratase small subunit